MKVSVSALVCLVVSLTMIRPVAAQGVVCQLPPDGSWVRFEGSYTQTEIRPDSPTGKLEIDPWIERVLIKSVGSETAMYRGASTKCRWIEIRIDRGREKEGDIDTGLTGTVIYKVLIPEKSVITDNVDEEGVPVSHLPIVKGYRRIGKADPKPLTEPALQLYPVGLLVGYYRELKVVKENADPEVRVSSVSRATHLEGDIVIERPTSRSVQKSSIWKTPEIPFGVARWSAEISREEKDGKDSRDKFHKVSEVVIEMKAKESGTDGPESQSELSIQ